MLHNNQSVIKKLIKRIVAANQSRNFYIISAIALTTLLIVSVFSIGMSYLKSSKLQEIRLVGTTAHMTVTNLTDAQLKKLHTLEYVKAVGLQQNAGLVENTPEMENMVLSLLWYDKAEWEQFRIPAVTRIVGKYPEKYNEIMVPLWILHNMGIENPQVGMKISLNYYSGSERSVLKEKVFKLSGYFTNYAYIRSGNSDSILVSDEFAKGSGNSVEKNGTASVACTDSKHVDQYNEKLVHDLSITGDQRVKTVPIYETTGEAALYTTAALAAIIFFMMLTGYLLIYNVMYISVTRDIRHYGLLKVIGATPKQLKKIVMGQALRLAAAGIPIGLIIGSAMSFAAVPIALGMFELETGTEISYNPLIFIGAAIFALLTTLIGAAKPAKIAAKIPPVEALRFTGVHTKRKERHSFSGAKPLCMAWHNIFRDRKRAAVVLLSLFLGITAFMVITTLVTSMDTDNYIASYVKNDFILKNNTLDSIGSGSSSTEKQKFDTDFLSQLKQIKGITNLRTTAMEDMKIHYDPKQYADHIEWFSKKFHIRGNLTDQQIQNSFCGYIIGLDSRYIEELNKGSKAQIDAAAFERGEIALIGSDNPVIYAAVKNMEVTIPSVRKTFKIPLGGFVPFGFQYAGGGMAPNIYVSETALKKWVTDPLIYKINIDVKGDLEEQALEKIKALTENDREILINSRLEQRELMTDAKLMMYILGGGIALILAFIGILNFVNVMSTGIMVRKIEFAMLESLGMTKRQLCRMLMLEGVGYAGITAFLTGTVGSSVTFGIFKLFQQQADYAIFTFPGIPILIITAIMFIVCAVTPEMAYRSLCNASIVERLHEA